LTLRSRRHRSRPARASDDASSSAPVAKLVLRDFTLTPTTITSGKMSSLQGSVSFDGKAAAGDAQFDLQVTLPGGAKQALPRSPVQGTAGLQTGTAAVALQFGPPAPGTYVITLTMVDAAGTSSNAASLDVTAE
jgi:hypothetical protein